MLVDSNIIIYASKPGGDNARDFIRNHSPAVSVISQVEVLGYHKLDPIERQMLEQFFQAALILPISDDAVDEAIHLRQMRKISLGDSLVAATAITHHLTLATHNTNDFSWIARLALIDPMI
jgi:predicted nucleic acid-binding protein